MNDYFLLVIFSESKRTAQSAKSDLWTHVYKLIFFSDIWLIHKLFWDSSC